MITQDPENRAQVISKTMDMIGRMAPAADKNLVMSFAPVILGAAPDRILFLFSPVYQYLAL